MKAKKSERKIDYVLIAIAIAAIVGIIAFDFYTSGLKTSTIDKVDLPDSYESVTSQLVLNEIMTNNSGVYVNSNSAVTDYIELYNGTGEDINLKGYGLSDKEDRIKYVFSDVTIKAGGYLVISLSGTNEEGTAGFKLGSKGGETIIFTNPQSKIIDSVETVYLGKNEVMIRTGDKSWSVSSLATPGYENSVEGKENYNESLYSSEEAKIQVNELLISNKGNYINDYGRMDGFLEIKNISDEEVDLSEYTVSNTISIPFRYQFESVILQPGEIYTINCGDGDYLHQDYLGFNFSNKEGTVILSHNGRIIQQLEYSGVANGQSYCFDGASYYATSVISPNQQNTAAGVEAFQKQYLTYSSGLVINEVMNSNGKYLAQNGTNYYDWIELYNNGTEAIQLSDYYLSLSDTNYYQYQLPEVELSAGGYYIVMCSGDRSLTNKNYVHTDFKLGENESIYLSDGNGLVDCMFVSDVPANYSYGKSNNAGYGLYYMASPSPKKANEAGKQTIAKKVSFSVASGIYNDVKNVTVELYGEGTIRYTTDGSEPTSKSKEYTSPIKLTKTTVVKAKCFSGESYASELFTQTYIINENHTMDVVSVSLAPEDFTYINNHYTVSYTGNTENASRYASIELLTQDGDGFNAKCAISVGGGFGKTLSKKSYTIKFTKAAGQSSLNYPVFDNRDCSIYDTLFLRSGSNDYNDTLIKDLLATSLVDDYTDIDTQAYRPVILYVNGEYWGIYTIREKINEHFIEDHYNVDIDDLSIIESNGYAKYGSYTSYNELRKYCRTHNLANSSYYEYVCSVLDIEAFVDYWVCELYTNNYDLGNVRYFSSSNINDGKFMPIFYDIDHGFHYSIEGWEQKEDTVVDVDEDGNEVTTTTSSTQTISYDIWNIDFYSVYLLDYKGMGLYDVENDIIRALFNNSSFRQLWYERLAWNLNNTFSKTNVLNRISELYKIYKPEISRDAKRWSYSVSNWESAISDLRNWAKNRPARLVDMTVRHFGLSETTKKKYFSGLY